MENRDRRDQVRLSRAATAQLIVFGTLLECGIGLLAIGAGWLLGLPLWEVVRWEWRGVLQGTLAAFPLLVLLLVAESLPSRPFVELREILYRAIAPLFRPATLPEIAMVSLVAGIGEEAFFRGIIQWGVMELLAGNSPAEPLSWASIMAVIAGAILFGLAHPLSPLYVGLATAIGIYLGLLFVMTGNLLVPMVAHGLYDFFAILYLTRRSPPSRGSGTAGQESNTGGEF